MNKSLLIIGIIVLLIGIFTGAYTTSQSHLFGLFSTTSSPYADFSIPLMIGGIVLIIVSIFIGKKK